MKGLIVPFTRLGGSKTSVVFQTMIGCLKSPLGQEYPSLESIAFLTVAVVNFQILQQLKDNLSQCLICGQSHKFYKTLFPPQKN